MLRRIGYAAVLGSFGLAYIPLFEQADVLQVAYMTVAAFGPILLGFGVVFIIAGWTLALEARRDLSRRMKHLDELEARTVASAARSRA